MNFLFYIETFHINYITVFINLPLYIMRLLLLLLHVLQFNMYLADEVIIPVETTLEEVHAFVSKLEPKKEIGWHCDCYNAAEEEMADLQPECRCSGKEFRKVPKDLADNLHRITIIDSDMEVIDRDAFQSYRSSLHDITLGNLRYLTVIEVGTFRNIPNLRTVYLSHAPRIKLLDGFLEGVNSKKFLYLRISQTGLTKIPDFSNLPTEDIMHIVELDSNNIEKISHNSFKIKAEQVTINYNNIRIIEPLAFNGSQIGELSLKGNNELKHLAKDTFKGLESLRQLDLSETSIENLPILGLSELEVLKIQKVTSLKVIPSVHEFQYLKEAYLTHPFHCCAFKYPEQHDPVRHAQYEKRLNAMCEESVEVFDTGQDRIKRNVIEEETWGSLVEDDSENALGYEFKPGAPNDWTPNLEHNKGHPKKTDHSHLDPLRGDTVEHHAAGPLFHQEVLGTFHEFSAEIPQDRQIITCGNLTISSSFIQCYPEPNALNPCEDIMGSYYLRISVWFVVILAVVGNLAVIVVVLFSGGELTVQRFLMCNLAFADLCMGLYLLLIASMDIRSVGTYFNFAFDWQYGIGCQVAGFLTVFASQLSIYTLMIVTIERWFALAYAIYLTRRIRLGLAIKIMIGGWLYSIIMAFFPVIGVSNYSSTSICLPMEVHHPTDQAYLISMVIVNALAFILIVVCYAQIYFSLGYETRHLSTRGEMTIAKKMALLIFTDFACWAPIGFFALTALAGYPLIGVTQAKILLVFFYPLNSCANPYLYALMTSQYRKDFFILLGRLGICKNKARRYLVSSLPTNNTPLPLILRNNGRKSSTVPMATIEDAFV